jgi:acetyl esterase/lipase
MRFRWFGLILPFLGAAACLAIAAPPPHGVTVQRDIPYVTGGDPAQTLDLYLPEKPSDKPLPLVVFIHGGGWQGGSKSGTVDLSLLSQGYAAASLEYRFSQKALFPAQIQDCQAAIRWLRANSVKYNLDPQHIGVCGWSAGGHLVALLGTSGGKKAFTPIGGNVNESDRVQAVCDFFGPTDFGAVMAQAAADKSVKNIFKFNTPSDPYSCLIGVSLIDNKDKCDAVSPIRYVSKDNPPFLILHGTRDALVPFAQSEELVAAFKNAGVDVALQRLPGAGHGGPAFNLPAVTQLVHTFFDKHLKGLDVEVKPLPDSAVTTK